MKRLIITSFILVFAGSMAFAQNNSASVAQTGNSNGSAVSQNGSANTTTVTQDGDSNTGDVSQNGTANEAVIDQGIQNILSNFAFARIGQNGESNQATIKQRQGFNGGTTPTEHTIDQIGDLNEASFTAFNGGHEGSILQEGDRNQAQGVQANGGSMIDIRQLSNDNWARARQFNGPSGSMIDIEQRDGDFNRADVLQRGPDNTATIRQAGNENDVMATQEGSFNGVLVELGVFGGADLNNVDFSQNGNGNYLETKQVRATGNNVVGSQAGDDNFFRVGIRGERNDVNVSTTGDGNRGSWGFTESFPELSEDNTFTLTQNGSYNITSGEITGDNNTITLLQSANNNAIGSTWFAEDGVVVEGDFNTVSISQLSNANQAFVNVAGNSNTATITQN